MYYIYGMTERGCSPGCQPTVGLCYRANDRTGNYYDLLIYDRELTEAEMNYYDLEYCGETPSLSDDPT